MRRVLVVLGLMAVALAGYVAAATAAAGHAARSAQVSLGGTSVDVSGLDRAGVEDRLSEVESGLTRQVAVDLAGTPARLAPTDAGLRLDRQAISAELTGRTWNPVRIVQRLAGQQTVAARPVVDRATLDEALSQLDAGLGDSRPVEGAITMDGTTPRVRHAAPGRAVNVARSGQAFVDGWTAPPVKLVVDTVRPKVDDTQVNRALVTVRKALAAPLTPEVAGKDVTVKPAAVARALTFTPGQGQLVVGVDPGRMESAILAAAPDLAPSPKDAQLVFRGGRPQVVPARVGVKLDRGQLAPAALRAMTASGPGRTFTVTTTAVQPKVTTASLNALGVKEIISEFATGFPHNPPRTANIRQAASVVDGTLVKPGQTFSLNQTLGERTAANGYHKAAVIEGGNLVEGYGGGVSQVATTLFNGVFFAGLQDVEHRPHSLYFKRYPEGREATLAWGATDLKFRNDSGKGVYIRMWISGNQVRVQFWGTKRWTITSRTSARNNLVKPVKKKSNHPRCIPQTPQTGFSVTVTRVFSRGGSVVKTEQFRTRYNAEDEITCTAPGRG